MGSCTQRRTIKLQAWLEPLRRAVGATPFQSALTPSSLKIVTAVGRANVHEHDTRQDAAVSRVLAG